MYSGTRFCGSGERKKAGRRKKNPSLTMESWWASRHSLPVVNGTQVSPLSALFTAL